MLTQSQKDSTFDSYLSEILSIQASFDEPKEPGNSNSDPSGLHQSSPAEDTLPTQGLRKDREPIDSGDESDGDRRTKWQKLVELDMPWYTKPTESSSVTSNPSCQETRRLLRAFNRDVAKAKFLVKIAHNSPSGTPSSQ